MAYAANPESACARVPGSIPGRPIFASKQNSPPDTKANLANPVAPQLLSTYTHDGYANGLAVSGDYIYVISAQSSLGCAGGCEHWRSRPAECGRALRVTHARPIPGSASQSRDRASTSPAGMAVCWSSLTAAR